MSAWSNLNLQIVRCEQCPRLIEHCQKVASEKRKAYRQETYWGKPVPNFGNQRIQLLIVGLAPGAHGANRTGRMFTGDRSGEWLYRALFKAGFCNQPTSTKPSDGLKLQRCAITAVCHCAPPDNKPNRNEIENCSEFLAETIRLSKPRVLLALGGIAWKALVDFSFKHEWLRPPKPKFGHGVEIELNCSNHQSAILVGCYHPSQQNTFTGRLTENMLDDLFERVNTIIDGD